MKSEIDRIADQRLNAHLAQEDAYNSYCESVADQIEKECWEKAIEALWDTKECNTILTMHYQEHKKYDQDDYRMIAHEVVMEWYRQNPDKMNSNK